MPRAYSPRAADVELPPGRRFPMAKYARVADRLAAAGWRIDDAPDVDDDDLVRVHDAAYLADVAARRLDARAVRRLGFPQSAALVRRSRASIGDTVAAARAALGGGLGVHLAGGTHHAFRDRGEGFGVDDDLAVAASALLASGEVRRVAIVVVDPLATTLGGGNHGDPDRTVAAHAAGLLAVAETPGAGAATC